MTTLYKKDTKGKVRILNIFTEGADLVYQTGLHDGKLIEHRKTCKGKNIGKSNETTPEEQATQEAQSKIDTELSTGYFFSYEEALGGNVVLPMLALTYEKVASKIDWSKGVIVQRKLDGQRCLAEKKDNKVSLISRKGKLIDTLPHINMALNQVMKNGDIYDGELYVHGESFQTNMSLIKRNQPGSERVKLCIYDQVKNLPYQDRILDLSQIIGYCEKTYTEFEVLEYDEVYSEEEMKKLHSQFLSEGYEGTMVKHGDKGYEIDKRSDSLLKYKDWIDIALPIKDIEPAEQRPGWGVPVFHWPGAKDNELRAGWKFDHAFREELLKNKEQYVGKTAEIRFFEYSEEGVPRMPVMYGIRNDK